jgi:hypothetical protein
MENLDREHLRIMVDQLLDKTDVRPNSGGSSG